MISDIFDAQQWQEVPGFAQQDITYHRSHDNATVRIAFNRADCRNAFRPQTVDELLLALTDAAEDARVGTVLLTGNGPSPKDGGWAFSAGGDQRVRGADGYQYHGEKDKNGENSLEPSRNSLEPGGNKAR